MINNLGLWLTRWVTYLVFSLFFFSFVPHSPLGCTIKLSRKITPLPILRGKAKIRSDGMEWGKKKRKQLVLVQKKRERRVLWEHHYYSGPKMCVEDSQHSNSTLTLSKQNTCLALKETSCTLVFHARQVYVTTNMAHHKHISSQWARYKEKENRASCLM